MPDPTPTYTYSLGLEITGGTVTPGLTGISYTFNPTTIYTNLSGFSAVPVWYQYDSVSQTYTKVTTPGYTASITSRSLSTGDTSVTLGTSSSQLILGGNYSNLTYPGNDIRGIYHNGIYREYKTTGWGDSVLLDNPSNFGELDALTKFFLEIGPKTVTITVGLTGNTGTGPDQTDTVTISQIVNNLSLSSESLSSYISQTYFGRGVYPLDSDGNVNSQYFDGLKYE